MISEREHVSAVVKITKTIYEWLTPILKLVAVCCAVLCCFQSAEGSNSRKVCAVILLITVFVLLLFGIYHKRMLAHSREYRLYRAAFSKKIEPGDAVPLLVMLAIVLIPFYILVITSLKNTIEANDITFSWFPKEGIDVSSYRELFSYGASTGITMGKAIINSFVYAFIPVFAGLFVSAVSAYAFAKLEFKGKKILYRILIMTMMMPGCVTMTTAYIMYEWYGWTNTPLPLIVPGCLGGAATVMFLREYFMGIPDGILEAARIDGAGKWSCFFSIMLPLGKPALVAQFILGFITAYNDFVAPLIYLNDPGKYTVQVALNFVNGTIPDQTLIASAGVFSLVPMLLLYVIFQKRIISGISMSSGLKG